MSLDPVMPPYNSSDPTATFLSTSCLDFLLIELVPLAYRVTHECDFARPPSPSSQGLVPDATAASTTTGGGGGAAATTGGAGATVAGGESALTNDVIATAANSRAGGSSSVSGPAAGAAAPRRIDEEEELDAVHFRLESLGYRVGQGLVERFSRDRPRFNDTLDVIKFLCKDLWSLVFGKNIDNLKTNHRGVYVLTDNVFRPFSRMSTEAGGQAVVRAQPFLWFPCGIVRGALAALGITATVQAEINELPGAVFQIKTLPNKS
ncbi:trafficking protein particle complex subunit 33 [Purpureocillium lilacinum]|uniref:trafficking protein particle complex subunit 33 n=1 Tax=Purpureocillium lilacinum TaxID=33203 RepID=UPI00208D7D69|nr:trafficking protein particle complex subunit 33 [Purpureocillium lilacinum]